MFEATVTPVLVACFGASRCHRVVCRVNFVQNVQIDVCYSQLPWYENSHVWNQRVAAHVFIWSADMVRICLTRNELEGPHELGRRKSKRFSSRQNLGRWQNATRSEILWKSFMGKFNTFFVHDELLHQRRCIISHFCVVHTKTSFALGPPPGKQFRTAEHWISLFFP